MVALVDLIPIGNHRFYEATNERGNSENTPLMVALVDLILIGNHRFYEAKNKRNKSENTPFMVALVDLIPIENHRSPEPTSNSKSQKIHILWSPLWTLSL